MGSYSKQKGASFERTVSEILSHWASDMMRKDVFWRSAGSGSRFTAANRGRVTLNPEFRLDIGDIVARDALGALLLDIFVVECKDWASLDLRDFFYQQPSALLGGEWLKLANLADKSTKMPLMIAKEKLRRPFVLTTAAGYAKLCTGLTPGQTLEVRANFPCYDIVFIALPEVIANVSYSKVFGCTNLVSR